MLRESCFVPQGRGFSPFRAPSTKALCALGVVVGLPMCVDSPTVPAELLWGKQTVWVYPLGFPRDRTGPKTDASTANSWLSPRSPITGLVMRFWAYFLVILYFCRAPGWTGTPCTTLLWYLVASSRLHPFTCDRNVFGVLRTAPKPDVTCPFPVKGWPWAWSCHLEAFVQVDRLCPPLHNQDVANRAGGQAWLLWCCFSYRSYLESWFPAHAQRNHRTAAAEQRVEPLNWVPRLYLEPVCWDCIQQATGRAFMS